MFRNLSYGPITLILTIFLSITNVISVLVILSMADDGRFSPWWYVVLSLITLSGTYFFVHYVIQKFVQHKISVIYQLISNSKQRKSYESLREENQLSIDKVTDQVVEWAKDREIQISDLTKLEGYRRSFLGNISHELKTPIFSSQGYIHTLLEGGLHDETINMKYLKKAASNLDRLQAIVEDLEEINQLQSGKIPLASDIFDLKELVVEVSEDLEFVAQGSETKIALHPKANQNFSVVADKEKIRQVLQNLVNNAIKYGKKGGTVTIGFYDLDKQVLVEVEDNGAGIEEQHLNHVFDRFYRVDEGRSRKKGGSGLGLSIVKHIIEAHNQTVSVRSTLGEGSTFGFTLSKSR